MHLFQPTAMLLDLVDLDLLLDESSLDLIFLQGIPAFLQFLSF